MKSWLCEDFISWSTAYCWEDVKGAVMERILQRIKKDVIGRTLQEVKKSVMDRIMKKAGMDRILQKIKGILFSLHILTILFS
jgi:hypothetical protein